MQDYIEAIKKNIETYKVIGDMAAVRAAEEMIAKLEKMEV